MNTNEIRKKKDGLNLTSRQRSILVGLILGDGHLETQNNGRTYRLKVEHSFNQKEYVQWLYQEFKELVPSKIYTKQRGVLRSIGFTTYSHSSFRFYGQQFYNNKVKHIPKIISKLLDSLSLAVWFMDDGSHKSAKHQTYNIHTLGYKKEDLVFMQKLLLRLFKVHTSLHKQKTKSWRIYVLAKSAVNFTAVIKKHIIPSMKYKLVTQMPKK